MCDVITHTCLHFNVRVGAWTNKYIPLLCVGVINYPWLNPDVSLANLLEKRGPKKEYMLYTVVAPGVRLSLKMSSRQYRNSHYIHDHLIFMMEIPYLERPYLYRDERQIFILDPVEYAQGFFMRYG